MIANIYSAPDDALISSKSPQNPISNGLLTPRQARLAALIVALATLILYSLLGIWTLIFGFTLIVLGFFSASQRIARKTDPAIDLFTDVLILAGLPLLISHFAFATAFNQALFWVLAFVLSICWYGKLDQPAADMQRNPNGQSPPISMHFSKRTAHVLTLTMLVIAVFTGAVILFIKALVPIWVAILILVLATIFSIPRVLRKLNAKGSLTIQGIFQKSLETAAVLGLFLQFFVPWLLQFFSIPL